MTDELDLTDRRAIVTGGASGIGRATARMLAAAGADVVVTDIDEPGGARVADEVGGSFAVLDVADPTSWDRVIAAAGPFDIAHLNAGISTYRGVDRADDDGFEDLPDDAYRRIMGINVDGVVYGVRAVLPGMIERGAGDVVATASMAGLVGIPFDPIYGLTKHAVVGLIRSLAADHERRAEAADICFSAICPGFTDTNIIEDGSKAMIGEMGLELMAPDHVADVVGRSIGERVQGAQWVIWPGVEPHVYAWNPAVEGR
jgi:NAD(P)-dependent dehydrogenase (short-subunit alcohol dehydrogenase family)